MAIVWPMRFAASLVAVMVGILAAGAARAGETKCWFEHGALVVPAAFADIAGDFILDLSAPHSQLHETMALAHGIEAATPRGDLALAGVTISDFPMQVENLDARSQPFVTSIAGVLGADIARRFVIALSGDAAPSGRTPAVEGRQPSRSLGRWRPGGAGFDLRQPSLRERILRYRYGIARRAVVGR